MAETVANIMDDPLKPPKPMRTGRPKYNGEPLFMSEDQIAQWLGQSLRDWKTRAMVLERHGLPRIDPLMGGRYRPAVKAFFDRQYGISNVEVVQPDGEENLDALR